MNEDNIIFEEYDSIISELVEEEKTLGETLYDNEKTAEWEKVLEDYHNKAQNFGNDLQADLSKQPEKIVKYIARLTNLVEGVKAEKKRLDTYQKINENKLERMKEYVKTVMMLADTKSIDTTYGRLTVRQNPLSIDDENIDIEKVPERFKKTETVVKVDKKAIIQEFKETGEMIEGVRINTNKTSLSLK